MGWWAAGGGAAPTLPLVRHANAALARDAISGRKEGSSSGDGAARGFHIKSPGKGPTSEGAEITNNAEHKKRYTKRVSGQRKSVEIR